MEGKGKGEIMRRLILNGKKEYCGRIIFENN